MGDKLERIFEFRVLCAKEREHSVALTQAERARYVKLKQELPDRVPAVDDRDALTVLAAPLPAQYVVAGAFGAGTLRNASAMGLAVATAEAPPKLGQRLILHVNDSASGTEYTFPCRVVSRVVKAPASMGVRFEGMPSQTRMGHQSGAVWRADVLSSGVRGRNAANGGDPR